MNTAITSAAGNARLTMSSREIAELTGSTHDNVLKTIRGLIKKGLVSGNETPYIHPQNGQTYKEFHLDYRNTMVVTSGYSVELRAKIIDRWLELEGDRRSPVTPKPKRIRKPAFDTAFTRCMNVVALLPNVDENQKVLMAARGTYNLTGVNPLEAMGYASLPAPTQDNYLTPTELGLQLGLSGQRVNRILAYEAHLQVENVGSSSGSKWAMTEKGLAFGRMFDTTRKGGKGSQQQLKWKPSVIEFLRPFAAAPAKTA